MAFQITRRRCDVRLVLCGLLVVAGLVTGCSRSTAPDRVPAAGSKVRASSSPPGDDSAPSGSDEVRGQRAQTGTVPTSGQGGSGLQAGTYPLREVRLAEPVWGQPVGVLLSGAGGLYEGTLHGLAGAPRARLEISGSGLQAKGKLVVDLNGDRVLDEPAVASTQTTVSGGEPPQARLAFPEIAVGQGRETVGCVVSAGKEKRARVYRLVWTCHEAEVPTGKEKLRVRLLARGSGRAGGDSWLVWLDGDGDGRPAEWEVTALRTTPVGIAGGLSVLSVISREALKVTAYTGSTGTVVFDATDGRGKPSGIYSPVFSTAEGPIQYLGVVQSVRLPAGSAQLSYSLPVQENCVAMVRRGQAVSVPAGGTVTVTAGGPVKIAVEAGAEGGVVDATVTLTTASGDDISGTSGSDSLEGRIEVIDDTGKVLASGSLEFG